jgi:uncharacterized surface protein with fasciclin (FAS1) repeats
MKNTAIPLITIMVSGLVAAQTMTPDLEMPKSRDLLTTAQANPSLSMFMMAMQSSGIAKMLQEPGSLTVFALSNRAFANLTKDQMDVLLTNPAAMQILLAHYVARGRIRKADTETLASAQTVMGVKLRADVRGEGPYVNGAKLDQGDIRCTNGILHVLDSFDGGLVHAAISISTPTGTAQ